MGRVVAPRWRATEHALTLALAKHACRTTAVGQGPAGWLRRSVCAAAARPVSHGHAAGVAWATTVHTGLGLLVLLVLLVLGGVWACCRVRPLACLPRGGRRWHHTRRV